MTTTDTTTAGMPTPDTGPAPRKRLRRSRTNRVGAGVCAGLGDYFGVDPVLFRVLFATAAFFGGAGILAYLLAWAAVPEEGIERAPIDGWIGELRRRRIPPWVVIVVGGLVLWAIAFSWWAPGPFLPVVAVAVVLVIVFGRRELQNSPSVPSAPTINLMKTDTATPSETAATQPNWVADGRAWFDDARAAHAARRRRVMPVKLATLGTLVAALVVMAILDSTVGIPIYLYFWMTLATVAVGLAIGAVLRRAPWGVTVLLVLAVAGTIAFSGNGARIGDGIGNREWRPAGAPAQHYRLAFGKAVLDLRKLPQQTAPRTIDVRLAAGQVEVIAPPSLNLTVNAHIHLGQLDVRTADGASGVTDGTGDGGVGFNRTVDPPAGATGAPITVDVHLANGQITVRR